MKTEDLLVVQLVLTLLVSIGALATSSFVIFRIYMRERHRLNEAEKHAFELYDAIFQSFIPRTLSDKLSDIYKTEVDAQAMNAKPIIVSSKQINPSQSANVIQPGQLQPQQQQQVQPGQQPLQPPQSQPQQQQVNENPANANLQPGQQQLPQQVQPGIQPAANPGIPPPPVAYSETPQQPTPTTPAPVAAPTQPSPAPAVAAAQSPALPP